MNQRIGVWQVNSSVPERLSETGIDLEAHLAFNCLNNSKEVIQFYSKVIMDRSGTSQAVSSDPKQSSKKKGSQQTNRLSMILWKAQN